MTATTELGQVLRDADGVRLQFRRSYPDTPITEVWSACTDPDRLARWFGRWTGDPSTGAVQIVITTEGGTLPEPVRIDECSPPTSLAVTLTSPDGPWPLLVSLSENQGTTSLEFVHHLVEPYDADNLGPGWHYYLDRLTAMLAGTALPEDFDDYHPAPVGSYLIPDAT